MTGDKQPNARLAAVMREAEVSNKGLAVRVQRLGVRCDHVDVGRWLKGMVPKDPKPRLIARALSEKVGRRVMLGEIGFPEPGPTEEDLLDRGTEYPENTRTAVGLLSRLADADLNDSPLIVKAKWAVNATPQVITAYLFSDPLGFQPDGHEPLQGVSAAPRIRGTATHLMQMDFQLGGGHTRKLLLHFFREEVVPLLRQSHPEPVRREIFGAAAEVAHRLAWSAYDSGRHGAAMRYYVQALRLASETRDRLLGGSILAGLSHQANFLGNFDDAVRYARAAQTVTMGKATPTVASLFYAMEARGLANLQDEKETARALSQAEASFDRRNPESEPDWINYFDQFELAGEASHCFRDLGKPKETRLFVAGSIDPVHTPPRTRSFIQLVAAESSLTAGEPDEAILLATEAIQMAGDMQSTRYLRYVSDFHKSLTGKHGHLQATKELTELIQDRHPTILQSN